MCGIAGVVHARMTSDALRQCAVSMADGVRHRGPDSSGVWVERPAALSHRRLEVIDLSSGGQPMMSDCGRFVIVFNGEIYNFQEVRVSLETKGRRFRTTSDTEVLLQAYMEYGESCLSFLEGMFAFAIWDTKKESLFAARDRMGKKPFYYTCQNGIFAFASELSSLAHVPDISFNLDMQAMAQFLTCKYVPTPGSIYTEARKLQPGHCLRFGDGEITVARYWSLPSPVSGVATGEVAERIRSLLEEAVGRRLISDVPLGAFLSGGLDSTVIVSLMSRLGNTQVKTFSIGFEAKAYDESAYAAQAARFAGTDHRNANLTSEMCAGLVSEVVGRFDEPLADPSIIPTYFLSRFVKQHVTVALSGDGADELFGGYEHFPAFLWAQRCAALGAPMHLIFEGLRRMLPVSPHYISPGHAVGRFAEAVKAPAPHRVPRMLMAFSPEAQKALWVSAPSESPELLFGHPAESWKGFEDRDPLDAVFNYYARTYLLDYILTKVDRCSMMHGLEVRSPFLDTALVEFVFSLPGRFKVPGGKRKHLMKQALSEFMPSSIQKRNKRGFLMPVAGWLGSSLKPQLERFTDAGFLKRQGLFRPEAVKSLIFEHENNVVDRREELWTFLVLQLWLEANGYTV
ncbi:asparagine synthase (glutamine-hydrolyzing) [Pseudodesulfovibrio methanolicus]|uniref:asparagine synthase (glutamine-hydrolyzing) n=1 Tax=Pseudodesulfovibrio methanolicus TaxID=3126690 RepID=A0ABZ2ITS0_9BACT